MTNVLALPAGTELVGDFRIERVLGAGGFGITYLAQEIALARLVTIKEYFPADFAARGENLAAVPREQEAGIDFKWGLDRFIDEAQTLARFDHRNIVKVYRYFRANDTAYMVLHFEEGQSLKAWLKSLGRFPRQRELDDIVRPLLDALDVIHAADFLHRDIAPDNIIIRTDGSPVLIDFGSARGDIARHSRTVSALVKPGYSPYEQYAENGTRQGPWTDIYALGATLYHAISGRRPPDAPSRVVKDELLSARDAALAAYRLGFLGAIDRALALDTTRRPQSIAAWRGDLLAPDPDKPGWLKRAVSSLPPRRAEAQDAKTRVLTTPPGAVPPPPDVPGAKGGLLDYIDGIKRQAAPQPGLPLSPLSADPAAAVAGDAAPAAPQHAAGPPSASSNPAPQSKPPSQPRRDTRSREPMPVPAVLREKPKPPRPQRVRSGAWAHWRSFAFKFLVGAGIAGGAIALQDRLPRMEARPGPGAPAAVRPAGTGVAAGVTGGGSGSTGTLSIGSGSATVSSGISVVTVGPLTTGPLTTGPVTTGTVTTSPMTTAAVSGTPVSGTPASANGAREASRVQQLTGHPGGTAAVGFTEDGRSIVTAGADSTLKTWNAATGALLTTATLASPATTLAVRGRRALTGHADGTIDLWDIDSGNRVERFRRNGDSIRALAFVGDGSHFVVPSLEQTIDVWDTRDPKGPVNVLDGLEAQVQAVAYSSRGPFIAAGAADGTVRLWRAGESKAARSYRGNRDEVSALTFSPDGRYLAAATRDGRIRVWATSSSSLYRSSSAHKGSISGLAFSPDGDMIASAGEDGGVQLWDFKRSRSMRAVAGEGVTAKGLAFSPDGARVAVASSEGAVRFWDAPQRSQRP